MAVLVLPSVLQFSHVILTRYCCNAQVLRLHCTEFHLPLTHLGALCT